MNYVGGFHGLCLKVWHKSKESRQGLMLLSEIGTSCCSCRVLSRGRSGDVLGFGQEPGCQGKMQLRTDGASWVYLYFTKCGGDPSCILAAGNPSCPCDSLSCVYLILENTTCAARYPFCTCDPVSCVYRTSQLIEGKGRKSCLAKSVVVGAWDEGH